MGGAFGRAGKAVADDSNPRKFIQRLRGLPLIGRLFRILDRFL